jgi:hypothetical protein
VSRCAAPVKRSARALPIEFRPLAELARAVVRELAGAVEKPGHWHPLAETARLMAERAVTLESEVFQSALLGSTSRKDAEILTIALAAIPDSVARAMAALGTVDQETLDGLRLPALAGALLRATTAMLGDSSDAGKLVDDAIRQARISALERGSPVRGIRSHTGARAAALQLNRALEACRASMSVLSR